MEGLERCEAEELVHWANEGRRECKASFQCT
jgi:hypothetical protein